MGGEIQTCPLCQGIGRLWYVNREDGTAFVPQSWHYLTATEKEKQRAADEDVLPSIREERSPKTHGFVTDECHGCLGRGLVSAEGLKVARHYSFQEQPV